MFVEERIAEAFSEKLVRLLQSRKIGDPEDKSVFQGPQGDQAQRDRIIALLDQGAGDGEVVCGGKAMAVNGKGFFVEPTVISGVPDHSILMKEELFGPVVLLNTFRTDEEALRRANNTEYGLYSEYCLYNTDRLPDLFEKDMH